MMRAVILAAGAGTRLKHLTKERPKCLVPLGGRPLLDHQLQALRGVGIDDIVIVVGFEAEQVRRHCGTDVTYVVNQEWETTNSIFSFYLAAEWIQGPRTLLLNCDILFDGRLLSRLVETETSVIAVDSQAERLAGEMNVITDAENVVQAIGKHLPAETTDAVSVQLASFNSQGADLVRSELERLVLQQVKDAFPTSAYGPLVEQRGLLAIEAGDLPWAEIDSVEDFQRAEKEVVPKLQCPSSNDRLQ
jgi:choline kinase